MIEKKRVTMKDIAQKTGYSINTVSLALKGINTAPETREKILKAADELGYIGNSIASSMRSGSTQNLAIIVGDISNLHFGRIIKTAVNIWSAHNYNAIIYNTDEKLEYERNAIISAFQQNVAGILISPVRFDDENLALLKKSGIPFVTFGSPCDDPEISTVTLNDEKGGYIATKYLIERGHKNILFLNANGNIWRLNGYLRAMKEYGLPVTDSSVLTFDLNSEYDWTNIQYKICYKLDYTAIVAFNDMVAMRIFQFLQEDSSQKKISASDIVAFDNIIETFHLPVNIPSVSHSSIDISHAAPQLLLDQLESQNFTPQKILLDVKLHLH